MPNCIDQILCNKSDDCIIRITDINGEELDTRFLHDGDKIYLEIEEQPGKDIEGIWWYPVDGGKSLHVRYDIVDGRYAVKTRCGGTYTAVFQEKIYNVLVIPDSDNHGSTTGSGMYSYNEEITITATENQGYHFTGWYIDNELISSDIIYQYIVTDDVIIIAKFEADLYSVVATPNPSAYGEASGSGYYEYGDEVTLGAYPFEGSYFIGWNDGDTNPEKNIIVTQNATYVANFGRQRCVVTVRIINHSSRPDDVCGVVSGAGEYDYGYVLTLYETPNTGFSFVSWNEGEATDASYTLTVTGDTEITATFTDAQYTLTLLCSPTNGGHTTDGFSNNEYTGGTYPYATGPIATRAVPNSGYYFDKWDDNSQSDYREFTITHNITRTAHFIPTPNMYTLYVQYDMFNSICAIRMGNTTVGISSGSFMYATVPENTILTVYMTDYGECSLIGWEDEPQIANPNIRTFVMTSDITITAKYLCPSSHTVCVCDNFPFDRATVSFYRATMGGGSQNVWQIHELITTIESIDELCFETNENVLCAVVNTVDERFESENLNITTSSPNVTKEEDNMLWINCAGDMEFCADIVQNKIKVTFQNEPADVLDGRLQYNYHRGDFNSPSVAFVPNTQPVSAPLVDISDLNPPTFAIELVEISPVNNYAFEKIVVTNSDTGEILMESNVMRVPENTDSFTANTDITITAVYTQIIPPVTSCEVGFEFDNEEPMNPRSTIHINNDYITDNVQNYNIGSPRRYNVIPSAGHIVEGVFNISHMPPSPSNYKYCYVPYPFLPQSSSTVWLYGGHGEEPTSSDIYHCPYNIPRHVADANSHQYVEANGNYAELQSLDFYQERPEGGELLNLLSAGNSYMGLETVSFNQNAEFSYNGVMHSLINPTISSPLFIGTKDHEAFYIKLQIGYSADCNENYFIVTGDCEDTTQSDAMLVPINENYVDMSTCLNITDDWSQDNPSGIEWPCSTARLTLYLRRNYPGLNNYQYVRVGKQETGFYYFKIYENPLANYHPDDR